jgi:hypothetical protein
MRRTMAILTAAFVLVLAGALAASSAPTTAERKAVDARAAIPTQTAGPNLADPTLSATYNDGFTTQTRAHAGSTAHGYVTAEEWAANNTNPLLTASGAPPTKARPCARFHLNYKVRRVQIDRVQLIDAYTGKILTSSSGAVNSTTARKVSLCAANGFDLTTANLTANPPTGTVYYTSVDAQIRWDDGTRSVVHYGSTVILNAWVIWGGPPA